MDKKQKLLLLANGFLGALAARGVTHVATDNLAFEGPFVAAWRQWQPAVQSPEILPKVGSGGLNRPRDIIFRVTRSTSPFKDFRSEGINPEPYHCTPEEFLNDWCSELPVSDWLRLADLFLQEVEARKARTDNRG